MRGLCAVPTPLVRIRVPTHGAVSKFRVYYGLILLAILFMRNRNGVMRRYPDGCGSRVRAPGRILLATS